MKKKLLLFTEQFPFGQSSETSFLQNEVKYLSEKFDVIIIPYGLHSGCISDTALKTDTSLAELLNKKRTLSSIMYIVLSRFFYSELFRKKIGFWNLKKLQRLASYVSRAVIVKRWFKRELEHNFQSSEVLLYTYWNNEITLGLGEAVKKRSSFKLITRAHGHDLYENKSFFGYIPCLKLSLELVDKFYTVSMHGQKYINTYFTSCENKVQTKYLGVYSSEVTTVHSNDGILRILSCSYLKKPKRVELIIKGISEFVQRYQYEVKWIHFGDGPEEDFIRELASNHQSDKFEYELKGFVPNEDVLRHYRENPVDLFITTTESEGLPVTLQEAQAHGIPVIGTAVNGIPEIINNRVGVLLSEDPGPDEISEAIYHVISDRDRFLEMKKNSIENWSSKFDAEKNYRKFVEAIDNLF